VKRNGKPEQNSANSSLSQNGLKRTTAEFDKTVRSTRTSEEFITSDVRVLEWLSVAYLFSEYSRGYSLSKLYILQPAR
jgi:hypothetical protein